MKKEVKLFCMILFAVVSSIIRGETGLTKDGSVLRFNVDEGDSLQWTEAFASDATAVVKTGTGLLEIDVDNSAFKGPVDIVEGVVCPLTAGNCWCATASAFRGSVFYTCTCRRLLKTPMQRVHISGVSIFRKSPVDCAAQVISERILNAHPPDRKSGEHLICDMWYNDMQKQGGISR